MRAGRLKFPRGLSTGSPFKAPAVGHLWRGFPVARITILEVIGGDRLQPMSGGPIVKKPPDRRIVILRAIRLPQVLQFAQNAHFRRSIFDRMGL